MKHISVKELYPLELEKLEFNLEVVGYDEEEIQFIYDNIYRDGNGVAYYLIKSSNKHFALN